MADVIWSPTTSSQSICVSLVASFARASISQQPELRRGRNLDDRFRRLSLFLSLSSSSSSSLSVAKSVFSPRKHHLSVKVQATVAETGQPKWWEKNAGPNMIDIHSTEDFLNALKEAGDRLVIVEFYGTWCASCRALFPKLCKTAEEHPEILFLKVNFDENKSLCKSLNVKVLPCFHFYRGADGQIESFSCSLAKFWKLRDAIERHCKTGDSSLESMSVQENNQSGTD